MADMFTEALQKSKAIDRMMDSFINKEQTAQDSLQLDELEKGKAGQIGEIRTWGGKKYQKTAKGWRPVKKSARESLPSEENKEEKSLKADNDWAKTIREYTACGGGNFGKVLEKKPNGDLLVEYIRRGEKPWTDVAKKGSEDWKHLKDEKPSMQKESSDKYEFVLRGKVDPINDKDWEKVSSEIDWNYADAAQIGQTVAYMGKVDDSDHPYAVKYYSPNGKNSDIMRLTEADYKRNLERDRKLQAGLDQKAKETEKKLSDGWKEGFSGAIRKDYPDSSDFQSIMIHETDDGKYRLSIGKWKSPMMGEESDAVQKKIDEIQEESYHNLAAAKEMADIVSQMKYSDIVKESKTSKEENHLSATKTRISKYEEKISAEIKKLQERLETAKKQAETAAKVEAAIPDVFKRAGLNLKSVTLILDEDNPKSQSFNIEAGIPGRFMVEEAHGLNSANDRAYEKASVKAATLSSMVESFFKEKGLTVKASINPYSLQYKDSSEKNNSTVEIDLKILNHGK